MSDAILTGRCALPATIASRYLDAADAVGRGAAALSLGARVPEVFFDRDGTRLPGAGFDAVIGNPPWDMIRADTGAADARSRARSAMAPVLRFTRDAGVYRSQSEGHANRYQLFVERAIALTRRGGRFGLVLPSGLATDHGSAALRRMLLSQCDVDAIIGMDNHRGVFPIHRSVRFLLVTATHGSPAGPIACRLGVDDPAELESVGDEPAAASPWFPVRVSPALVERISGPGLVAAQPAQRVRSRDRRARRVALSAARQRVRVVGALRARAERERRSRRVHATAVTASRSSKANTSSRFTSRSTRVRRSISAADARRRLRPDRYNRPRLAYRDVASATNRLTLIAAVLPAGCVSTHTVFCLRTPLPTRDQHFLCGLFNSFVVNYLVRLRVTTHVTTATVEQLPIPTTEAAPTAAREIAALSRHLSRRSIPRRSRG